ncbi:MAG: hypothetical protein IPK76_23140 [Lewinellaceae bacterium]|nr:hypothetical protein [Lewinellaceae bacterium]
MGSGLEIIDREAAAEHQVAVFSAPEGTAMQLPNMHWVCSLCLANHLLRADQQVRHFSWHREMNRGWEIAGRTVGIVGMGHTVAHSPPNCKVSVARAGSRQNTRRHGQPVCLVASVDAETIQREADIISLHLPLSEETDIM